jgi:signal transduction histidine kinase
MSSCKIFSQDEWAEKIKTAYTSHIVANTGPLTLPRRAEQVAARLCQLADDSLNGQVDEAEIISATMQLAENGLSLLAASAMLRTLDQADGLNAAQRRSLDKFQLLFLEKLAINREYAQLKKQERSQLALQRALHNQLEQQRHMHQAQEKQNETLNQVLQLNARLVSIASEAELLAKATDGICKALDLADVTLYDYLLFEDAWVARATTASEIKVNQLAPASVAHMLNTANVGTGEIVHHQPDKDRPELVTMAIILKLDVEYLAGLVINSTGLHNYSFDEWSILIRTFAQNLTALWRNLHLFTETRQRARELEILHGRYLDTIWNSETAALKAHYSNNNFQLNRDQEATTDPADDREIILEIGERSFGRLKLPENSSPSPAEAEFSQAIIREMNNALNNAQLLQTARAYSNQLSLAAEVSRAVTTILDKAQLTQEVVTLIRARFDYYYVGLFLIDETGEMAELLAGTGEAGRLQVENGHKLPLDGTSMISTAISNGQAHVAQDVRQAQEFYRNPLLPDTMSELAVPLRTRGVITGALTIQSDKLGMFAQGTIDVLQALADQLAVAIVNASLFARLQKNLNKTNQLYETSRKISSATTAVAVYQALVDFIHKSDLADAAYIISHAPGGHEFYIVPTFWSRIQTNFNWQEQFLRDQLLIGGPLSEKLTLINDCTKKSGLIPLTRHLGNVHQLHALALVPIRIEGEWLATLALQRNKNQVFTSGELHPLLTIIDQSAVILSNQQLLKQAKTLYRVGQSLSQVLTRDDALQITVNQVAKYTGASQCRFILFDGPSGNGKIITEHKPSELTEKVVFSIEDDEVLQQLTQEMKPLLLDDQANVSSQSLQKYVHQFGARASLLIPATSQQDLLGFLTIESHHGKRPFTQANTIFAQTVVDHMTTQIENLNLLEEALSRAQELITLNQIQSGISGILDLSTLAQTIYNQIGRLLDNTIFILARYQSGANIYEPILCMHKDRSVKIKPGLVVQDDPLHRLLHSQRHLMAGSNHPIMHQLSIPNQSKTPESSLWIPLLDDNQPTGLICLQSYEKNRYSETDIQLLRSIATQTSLAIANARLFEEIQASNEQLRQLDNLKNQFLANVSHELRTPLNSIIGFSKVILKRIDGPLTKDQEEDVTSIYENGLMLLSLINEILDMAKIEAGRMTVTFEEIDVEATTNRVLKNVRSLVDQENVELSAEIAPNLPKLEADPVRLRQILNNLLSNAAKFTNEGYIRLKMQQQDSYLHIAVEDTGIGIHQNDYKKLFRPFEQVENRDARVAGGTGLGLPITQWLVQMHNGRIHLESQLGSGSTFHVLLPFKQPQTKKTEEAEKASLDITEQTLS